MYVYINVCRYVCIDINVKHVYILQFGTDPSNSSSSSSSSSLLLAALGCVDLTSSMAQTLHRIDASVSVDKQIVLPNGAQFIKTKSNAIADRATRDNISHQKVCMYVCMYEFSMYVYAQEIDIVYFRVG